jgi:hypothetical protein
MAAYPEWLHGLAWLSLSAAVLCAVLIAFDEIRRPQKMAIMNLVWPITALYWGPIALWAYRRVATKTTRQHAQSMQSSHTGAKPGSSDPTRTQVLVAVSHCGAGCTLGDIAGEWWVAALSLSFAGGLLPTRLLLDFLLAWIFGVAFQYFTIVPMRGLSPMKGILAAIKADTISIVAYQVGMSVWMALTFYVIFPGPHLSPKEAAFWFMMQIAMIAGFFTAYPANRLLIQRGWKEKMPEMPDAAHALDPHSRAA